MICTRGVGTSKLAYIMMEIQGYGHEGRAAMYRTEILQITKLPITQIVRKALPLPGIDLSTLRS